MEVEVLYYPSSENKALISFASASLFSHKQNVRLSPFQKFQKVNRND